MTPGNVATLRVKTNDGSGTMVLKLLFTETVGNLRRYTSIIHTFFKWFISWSAKTL